MRLPIENIQSDFDDEFKRSADLGEGLGLIVEAAPGAGKTTLLPLWLIAKGLKNKIYLVQPRKLAAQEVAFRLAKNLDQSIGIDIGYRTKDKSIAGKKIEVVTEGVMLKILQSDPNLENCDGVVLDEFHERTIAYDLLLAMLYEVKLAIRNDLNLIVMSATLAATEIAKKFDLSILISEGRCFNVETFYLPPKLNEYIVTHLLRVLPQILDHNEGDVLVFLPGKGEINSIAQSWSRSSEEIVKLYSGVEKSHQEKALKPQNKRRVILSTNIAETSLTLEGIRIVVDSGWERRLKYNVTRDANQLILARISKASAEQRKGRAGRTQAGTCFRLWPENEELKEFALADILNSELKSFRLEVAHWGCQKVEDLVFLDEAPRGALSKAEKFLKEIKAIDLKGQITPYGKELYSLNINLVSAHFILSLLIKVKGENKKLDDVDIAEIANFVLLIESAPFVIRQDSSTEDNIEVHLEALDRGMGAGFRVIENRRSEILKDSKKLQNLIKGIVGSNQKQGDYTLDCFMEWLRIYPNTLLKQRIPNKTKYKSASGEGAELAQNSILNKEPWLIALQLSGDLREAKIQLAGIISEEKLFNVFKDEIKIAYHIEYNDSKKKLDYFVVKQIFNCEIEKQISSKKIVEANVKEDDLLKFLDDKSFQNEIAKLLRPLLKRLRFAQLNSPIFEEQNFDESYFLENLANWFLPRWDFKNLEDLTELNIAKWILESLDYELQIELEKNFPAFFVLDSDRKVLIEYDSNPLVSGKLQEFFGLKVHPTIKGGEIPLTVDLLSPAMRPIQRTADLMGFFKGSYAEVKKDMKAKYPRHLWPDDPTQEEASFRSLKKKPIER